MKRVAVLLLGYNLVACGPDAGAPPGGGPELEACAPRGELRVSVDGAGTEDEDHALVLVDHVMAVKSDTGLEIRLESLPEDVAEQADHVRILVDLVDADRPASSAMLRSGEIVVVRGSAGYVTVRDRATGRIAFEGGRVGATTEHLTFATDADGAAPCLSDAQVRVTPGVISVRGGPALVTGEARAVVVEGQAMMAVAVAAEAPETASGYLVKSAETLE